MTAAPGAADDGDADGGDRGHRVRRVHRVHRVRRVRRVRRVHRVRKVREGADRDDHDGFDDDGDDDGPEEFEGCRRLRVSAAARDESDELRRDSRSRSRPLMSSIHRRRSTRTKVPEPPAGSSDDDLQ